MKKKEFLYILLVAMIDQISKFLAEAFLKTPVVVIPNFFTLSYTENTGAAWSIFSGQRLLLILLSVIALIFLYRMYPSKKNKWENIFYLILCGGILGNLIDRILWGYVKDFLSFQFFGYQYPIFNLADIMIVIGAMVEFLYVIKEDIHETNSRNRRKNKNR